MHDNDDLEIAAQIERTKLRDHFAGQALAGLLASGPHDCEAAGIAHDAYLYADAMLAARNQPAP